MKYHVEFDIDFKRNPYKGVYIALEGLDGSGKTEQTEALAAYFIKQQRDVVITHEPRKNSTLFSDLIHKILLGDIRLSPVSLQYLFSADRVQNHIETVIPALEEGKVVISHRTFWSIVPYAISDLDPKLYENSAQFLLVANCVLSMYHQFIIPDYTFFLNVPVDEAMKRLAKRKGKKAEFYEKKNKLKKHLVGYQWLQKTFPKEFLVIDGMQPSKEVTQTILKSLKK